MPTKPKIVYRTRYRNRPRAQVEISGGPVNVGSKVSSIASKARDFQQILFMLGFIGAATWLFLGPFVNAQAEALLKNKLVDIGMDPASIQTLNNNLVEIQKSSDDRDQTVQELKTDLSKVLYLLEQQQRQQILYPPAMQAAPMPVPVK